MWETWLSQLSMGYGILDLQGLLPFGLWMRSMTYGKPCDAPQQGVKLKGLLRDRA